MNNDIKLEIPYIRVGLSWEEKKSKKSEEADLDISAICCSNEGQFTDAAYFDKKTTNDGALIHSGDCQTGEIQGYDETIDIDLQRVHPIVRVIVVTVTCYNQKNLRKFKDARVDIVDSNNITYPLTGFNLGDFPKHNAIVAYAIYRDRVGCWTVRTVRRGCYGMTINDIKEDIKKSLTFVINPGLMEEMKYNGNEMKFKKIKKGTFVSLENVNKVTMGLGWDPSWKGIDLDASVSIMEHGKQIEVLSTLVII